ncbi:uncharacterized protein A1O5_00652 [Cladophialophora psammophila CBS 110553]|uniref:Apple domain-containing protein n=1 Tax=Cladophialophora psammophila CBS 110553 TaxID=1182543 RepID=W9Y0W7_9EURO|nr:uncharacterized protein A1O5_00652 [Cladophialophora psammophila CBS 110553]EXJ76144.1 hypothetical protein A1O5_00652 [Cladophialophora psammophila CBS 110553]
MPWKKNLLERDVEPTCSCTDPIAAEWATNKFFADAATSAATPAGYYQAFNNGQAWISGDGFIGHTTIDEYDSSICAAICDGIDECSSFEIYFEKEIGGPAPAIKCSFWAGAIAASGSSSTNAVIAGCNGYTNSTLTTPKGFDIPVFMAGAAIHPPPTPGAFLGSKIFNGPFDTSNCAEACSSIGCKFFNTYIVSKNGVNQGQYCDMYAQPFGPEWATETGRSDGKTNFTISHSFACGATEEKRGESLSSGEPGAPPATTPASGNGKGGSWEERHPWHGSSPYAGNSASSASQSTRSSSSTWKRGDQTSQAGPAHSTIVASPTGKGQKPATGSSTNKPDGHSGSSDPVDATSVNPSSVAPTSTGLGDAGTSHRGGQPTNSRPGRPGRPSSSVGNPVKDHPGSSPNGSGTPASSTSETPQNPGSSAWGDWDNWSITTLSTPGATSLPNFDSLDDQVR